MVGPDGNVGAFVFQAANKLLICNGIAFNSHYFSAVKVIPLILAVYTLLLCLMPCADAHGCEQLPDAGEVAHHDDKHSHEEDLCSPFCVCSCCGTHVTLVSGFTLTAETVQSIAIFPAVIEDSFSTIDQAIWQPPRI